MLEGLFGWFQGFGPGFALLGLFLILVLDAMIFPALPELFAVLAFLMDPSPEWAVILLVTVCLAEVVGNSLLYAFVRWKKLPGFLERAMKKWTGFIIFSDERIILLNRVAPVMPFTGAFIATCGWNYRKSMAYLVAGGLLKYSALLGLVSFFDYEFETADAQLFSIAAVAVVICASLAASFALRWKHAGK
jgi:membrane protein YqaA with SNARE-associated domain